jgi:hypothetical protein
MAAKNLAESLAEDIAATGLAELVAPGILKANEGDGLAELQQEGDVVRVFDHSGDAIAEFSTADEDFNEAFLRTLATELNF